MDARDIYFEARHADREFHRDFVTSYLPGLDAQADLITDREYVQSIPYSVGFHASWFILIEWYRNDN